MERQFNAKAARTKRPCPIWVDAFQRDTQDLSAEEVGAYFLLLMAMWTRESCDLPDDDKRLARICRTSLTLWRRRLGPQMRGFFSASDGVLVSKRLQKEAEFVELSVTQQSNRKNRKPSDKSLNNKECGQSADGPGTIRGSSGDHPTQQPNNPTYIKEEAKASSKKKRASRLSVDWVLPKAWGLWALDQGMSEEQARGQADRFKDYWMAKAGKDGAKLDWEATWRNWCRKFIEDMPKGRNNEPRRHDRTEFDRAIARVADGLAAGSIHIETASRDPFASIGPGYPTED